LPIRIVASKNYQYTENESFGKTYISRPKLWLRNFDKDVFASLVQNGMNSVDFQMSTVT